ncbi:MAG: type II toxin-antitoxin system VapC family toxin [Caldilineaceae bacterium]|nr:type II toxin-antitoxin system VapC family toxin [Caldilineaceae bacterium]HRJ42919.1 type II toxin-antitoxin system VapC family toxin [Caldilineaceae bacterium]
MVIDTSAVMAILMGEPDAAIFAQAISADSVRLMSAATLLEAAIVIEARYGNAGNEKLDEFIAEAQIVIEPVTRDQITLARIAFRTYGKGRHRAGLNFGDCFSYALAKSAQEPLLYKGNDFMNTDIVASVGP